MTETKEADVFSVKTLSERWLCSQSTIYNMIKKRKIKTFKLAGTLTRITLEEVLRWEKEGNVGEATIPAPTASGKKTGSQLLSGTMKTAAKNKPRSELQTKAQQKLNSINSQLTQN